MINLYNYKGFMIFRNSFSSQETGLLNLYCVKNNIEFKFISGIKEYKENYIPLAGTDIMPLIFGYEPVPDYYPVFLKDYLKRNIEYKTDKIKKEEQFFIKPADKYKRFTGFIKRKGKYCKKKPPFWISDIVLFKSEFRYYITKGNILTGEWYLGEEIETPVLDIKFPFDYSGAVDFGYNYSNELLLIEAQHPYSCGWYGNKEKEEIYWQWLIDGFKYMMEKK